MAFIAPSVPPFPNDVPIVELERVSLATLQAGNSNEVDKLYGACSSDGIFLLNLTDSEDGRKLVATVDEMFKLGQELFGLDLDEKLKYTMTPGTTLGYKPEGAARGDLKGGPDRCEFWCTSKEDILGMSSPNAAPDVINTHRNLSEAFIRGAHALKVLVLSSLEAPLGMERGPLSSIHDIKLRTMDMYRLFHYPAQHSYDLRGSMAPHTDFGSITLLFNILGGLQFLPPTHSLHDNKN
ncbi:hypothetical protein BDV96DRAFT_694568 [Lophiotrema nucula]|uniref:Non-haem dioxygenase N-terminal domain-containing protein n=1 Tax=Lophiotrema nucula TaxID=690887 RepID=A0A6A5YFF8_9PLEO|nr:hypothetical protein BDV96DRAFT_694568 [Lophiotrema nucula]